MADIPSHWGGTYAAPNFSRAVAKAAGAVSKAEEKLLATMQREYPLGAPVEVVHYHGRFSATVLGWDIHGIRVIVLNDRTQKESKWWAVHVQRTTPRPRARRLKCTDCADGNGTCHRDGSPCDPRAARGVKGPEHG